MFPVTFVLSCFVTVCRDVEGQGLQGPSERTSGTHPSIATTTPSLFLQDEQASQLRT